MLSWYGTLTMNPLHYLYLYCYQISLFNHQSTFLYQSFKCILAVSKVFNPAIALETATHFLRCGY